MFNVGNSIIRLTVFDVQRDRIKESLEVSIEEATKIVEGKLMEWCLGNIGKPSPVVFDCFHKVMVSYTINEVLSLDCSKLN